MVSTGLQNRKWYWVKAPLSGVLLIATLSASNAAQAALPATSGWYEIPNTQMRAVCPPNKFGGTAYDFNFYCQYATMAWSGGAFDTLRNRMYIWGGGHSDYYGNEIYAMNLNTQVMSRLTDPALPVGTSTPAQSELYPYNGTQPNGRHTYDTLEYLPNADRMWAYSGSLSSGGGNADNWTWLFNPNDNTWKHVTPAGSAPRAELSFVSAYDANTGKIFLHDRAGLFTYEYDSSGGRYTLLANDSLDIGTAAVIDPKRKKFIVIGSGYQYIYDIGAGSTYARQSLGSTGGSAIVSAQAPGLAYDPVSDRIVAWAGGDTIYSLNVDTGVWSALTFPGGPGSAFGQGTYGRWQYSPASDVFLVYNSVDSNAFVVRLDRTGAKIPPAITLSSDVSSVAVGGRVTLTWSASNATSCSASGDWSGNKATSGSQPSGVLNSNSSFTLSCTGAGGTASQTVPVTVTSADSIPPAVPTGLTATTVSMSQIGLNWTAATDNVAVTGYRVYRNGALIASPATATYSDLGLAASTTYSYTVAAFDAANNVSALSASASATTQTAPPQGGADADWLARTSAPGVVRAIRFDSEAEYLNFLYPRRDVDPRDNAWDTTVKASGAGSLRFDIVAGRGEGGGGNWALNFSEDLKTQFGENEQFFIQWRERFDDYTITHKFLDTAGGTDGGWKMILIGQGDQSDGTVSWACPENQLAMNNGKYVGYPAMFHGCWVYAGLNQSNVANTLSKQNQVKCQYFPANGDTSGCLRFYANEWMTFQIGVHIGPATLIGDVAQIENTTPIRVTVPTSVDVSGVQYMRFYGTGIPTLDNKSSPEYFPITIIDSHTFTLNGTTASGTSTTGKWAELADSSPDYPAKGYKNSVVEFWVAREGQPAVLAHRQTNIVLRRDNYVNEATMVGADPVNSAYHSKYGKLWLTNQNTNKSATEQHPASSMWYDEIIVSRQRIADPNGGL